MKRGDIVIVEFPYTDGQRGKNRPCLIVQRDHDNQRLTNTIVAMISGNLRHAAEPTQVLVDPNSAAGASSGLRGTSVIKCNNLFTVRRQDVQRTVGSLSTELLQRVNAAVRLALDIS